MHAHDAWILRSHLPRLHNLNDQLDTSILSSIRHATSCSTSCDSEHGVLGGCGAVGGGSKLSSISPQMLRETEGATKAIRTNSAIPFRVRPLSIWAGSCPPRQQRITGQCTVCSLLGKLRPLRLHLGHGLDAEGKTGISRFTASATYSSPRV